MADTYSQGAYSSPRPQGGIVTARLITQIILGDCLDCVSYRELDEITPGVFHATTIHHPSCPSVGRRERGTNEGI